MQYPEREWRRIVWRTWTVPKQLFLSWQVMSDSLHNQDRLVKKKVLTSSKCRLWKRSGEPCISIVHFLRKFMEKSRRLQGSVDQFYIQPENCTHENLLLRTKSQELQPYIERDIQSHPKNLETKQVKQMKSNTEKNPLPIEDELLKPQIFWLQIPPQPSSKQFPWLL